MRVRTHAVISDFRLRVLIQGETREEIIIAEPKTEPQITDNYCNLHTIHPNSLNIWREL